MPSIFIWKSNELTSSNTHVQYYSGSNWFLEDNNFSSKSYMLTDQHILISNDTTVVFNAKKMPTDWVGSELLEVSNVPYEQIKSDKYGILEKIGGWLRFISTADIEFDAESLQNELVHIKKWMLNKESTNTVITPIQKDNTIQLSSENIQLTFQEFFNKYNTSLPILPIIRV